MGALLAIYCAQTFCCEPVYFICHNLHRVFGKGGVNLIGEQYSPRAHRVIWQHFRAQLWVFDVLAQS